MSCDFTFSTLGTQGYDHLIKTWRFDLKNKLFVVHPKGHEVQRYDAISLESLQLEGIGAFSAKGEFRSRSGTEFYRLQSDLGENDLVYKWEISKDDIDYVPLGLFRLRRVPPAH